MRESVQILKLPLPIQEDLVYSAIHVDPVLFLVVQVLLPLLSRHFRFRDPRTVAFHFDQAAFRSVFLTAPRLIALRMVMGIYRQSQTSVFHMSPCLEQPMLQQGTLLN